jgi:hypothetical protein
MRKKLALDLKLLSENYNVGLFLSYSLHNYNELKKTD